MLYAECGWCCAAGSRFGLQTEWKLESRFLQRYAQRLTHLLDGQPQGNLPFKNQLHVIYEDRLEILSFNNDYFVDQEAKLSGITYRRFT